jgi:raffinose/stachyose/melibiose transport system permease protein
MATPANQLVESPVTTRQSPSRKRPVKSATHYVKRRQLALYLAPGVLLVCAFFVFPLIFIIMMGFTRWTGLGPAEFLGVHNYVTLFHDPAFRTALLNTVIWALVGIFIHTPLCLFTALVLARKPRMWKLMRTLFFLPSIIATTALALLWYFLLHVDLGLINRVLRAVGLSSWQHAWLIDPHTALGSMMVPFVLYIGFGMVLLLTQISTIPRELYEAATLDGASSWQQDLYITIPNIRRAIALQSLFVVAFVLRMFEYPFVMTDGGPQNKTVNLSLYIYHEMVIANAYGLSMAAGVITVLVGAAMTSIVLLGLRWAESR